MMYMMALCAGMIESDQEGDPCYFLGLYHLLSKLIWGSFPFNYIYS